MQLFSLGLRLAQNFSVLPLPGSGCTILPLQPKSPAERPVEMSKLKSNAMRIIFNLGPEGGCRHSPWGFCR